MADVDTRKARKVDPEEAIITTSLIQRADTGKRDDEAIQNPSPFDRKYDLRGRNAEYEIDKITQRGRLWERDRRR